MNSRSQHRRGYTVAELAVAGAVISVVLVTIGQLAAGMAVHQRHSQEQRLVAQEAGNVLEQLVALPYEGIGQEGLQEFMRQRVEDESRLVGIEVKLEVVGSTPTATKRITVIVTHHAHPAVRCELVAWRHARRAEP